MPSNRAFQLAARLATATSVLMFGLIVVGSVVRTTGSGLSCPDWPLCQGRLIPPLQFNVLMEWLHRLIALGVGLLLFTTAGGILAQGRVRARLGGLAVLALVLYFVQALLGALTVWKLLDPSVVSGHLAVGLMLFGVLVTMATLARFEPAPPVVLTERGRPAGLLPLAAAAVPAVWFQAVLGGMVSTNHAGLACPDWPTCNGEWFPPLVGLAGLQVLHRFGAYALAALLVAMSLRAARSGDPVVRRIARWLPPLVLLQIGVGVGNVLLGLPVWMSALHLADAALMLALSLVAALRVAAQGATGVALPQGMAVR